MFVGPIEMLSHCSPFSPFQKVSSSIYITSYLHLILCLADQRYQNDPAFRQFRRQLFHASLNAILQSLREGMTTPEVVMCPDGHYRRAIYGLGPYIADYPEQVLLSCIVQGWCARLV